MNGNVAHRPRSLTIGEPRISFYAYWEMITDSQLEPRASPKFAPVGEPLRRLGI